MNKKQKLELTWIGKGNRPKLEPRILREDPEKSYHAKQRVTEKDIFDNRLIFGDNLLALRALEHDYANDPRLVALVELLDAHPQDKNDSRNNTGVDKAPFHRLFPQEKAGVRIPLFLHPYFYRPANGQPRNRRRHNPAPFERSVQRTSWPVRWSAALCLPCWERIWKQNSVKSMRTSATACNRLGRVQRP